MHRNFSVLAVNNDTHLRDPERVRRVFSHYFAGSIRAVLFLAAGSGLMLVLILAVIFGSRTIPKQTVLALTSAGLFLELALGIASLFIGKKLKAAALNGFLLKPDEYAFRPGKITGALKTDARRVLVRVQFDGGWFLSAFDPGLWASALEHRKADLPFDCWVLVKNDDPARAALAGIPARTAEALDAAAKTPPR